LGFKDRTNNVELEDRRALAEHVWVARRDDSPWMRDGRYLVARRIRMLIEV
jgi:deferrochelatase/peroxidase EfeB